MYFQESDTLLLSNPAYKGPIERIDEYLGTRRPEEQIALNIDVVADITGIDARVIRNIFDEYYSLGLLSKKYYITCPYEDDIIEEIEEDDNSQSPLRRFCDICGEEHVFSDKDITCRYSLTNFRKESRSKTINQEKSPNTIVPITGKEVIALSETMPLLSYYSNIIEGKPLENKRFIIILHFLKDLIPFIHACEKLGMNPNETLLYYKEYSYPHKETIITYLQNRGYLVSSLDSLDTTLLGFQDKCKKIEKEIIIIEDGGYLVPKIHEPAYELLKVHTIGAVEQTTKGEREDLKVVPLSFPVLSIARSELKTKYEPPHVARAVVNNIQRLIPHIDFSSRDTLLIGYGAIGKKIASQLKDNLKMKVEVYDLDPTRLVEATGDGVNPCNYLPACVANKFLIVGATGETSIGRTELLHMTHNTYIVSASSDQKEIGLKELQALSSRQEDIMSNGNKLGTKYIIRGTDKAINLIADGYPINFWSEESMPNNVSDLIMSLIYLSVIHISLDYSSLEIYVHTEKVNEISNFHELSKIYLEQHES
ncbi:MAG TPA: hypothetical protein PLY21_17825 [Spirochaetota bacterium]|nr:hypothetical protein [Methanothrix sp.]HPJ44193.1 hypothetical protein [Spirochaetota bacterium]